MAEPAMLWNYVLRYYTGAVPKRCLELQDKYQLDVDLLLFGVWLGATRHIALTDAALLSSDQHISAWRHDVIRPLREIRRRLKAAEYSTINAETQSLYREVLAAEIHGEKIELAALEALAKTWPDGAGTANAIIIKANLEKTIRYFGGSPPDVEPQIHDLLSAAVNLHESETSSA